MGRRKRKRLDDDSDSEDEKSSGCNTVEMIDNHIYFYADVTTESVVKLVMCLHKLNSGMARVSFDNPMIYLHINSGGGDVHCGLAAADHIASSRIPITTIVEGQAASAATLMSIVARGGRLIAPNGYMLIHQLSSGFWGKFSEIQDEYQNCKMLEEGTSKLYLKHTKLKKKELEKILKHDSYWNAQTCVSKGMVDRIGLK